MLNVDYISMGKTFLYSLKNSKKGIDESLIKSSSRISRTEKLIFSKQLLSRFCKSTNWKHHSIPPTFPYAILTHIHFDLVNDSKFPFSPYGLLHKKEEIKVLKPLVVGDWSVKASIDSYRKLDNGYEFDLISKLYINGDLSWESKTTAYKKWGNSTKKKKKNIDEIIDTKIIKLEPKMAREYAYISKNIDPIHMSLFSAKIMGHKSSIMHGMWGAARCLSECNNDFVGGRINIKFISPMYLPCEVGLWKNQRELFLELGLFNHQGKKPFLLVEVN